MCRALALARELGGEGLRPWAVQAVAAMPASKPEALSGYAWEGVEIAEIATEKAEYGEPPEPEPRAGARGARGPARRRRPLRAASVELPPTQPEPVEAAPPVDPALLEPVPMPDPDPPPRAWRSRVGIAVGLLVLLLGLRPPEPSPVPPEPTSAVGVAPLLDQATAPLPPMPIVESSPEPIAAVAQVGLFHRRVHVGLSGEAQRATLIGPRGEIPLPAEVRAGTYTLRVTFPGEEPIDFPDIDLSAGQRWEIRCSAAIMQCREIAVP